MGAMYFLQHVNNVVRQPFREFHQKSIYFVYFLGIALLNPRTEIVRSESGLVSARTCIRRYAYVFYSTFTKLPGEPVFHLIIGGFLYESENWLAKFRYVTSEVLRFQYTEIK